MTQEEKAKAYDEAIKKVNDYYEGKTKLYSDVDKTLNYLFPELKESEDDKIRKELICYFEKYPSIVIGPFNTKECIAWLEKQGQTFTKKNVDDAYLKGVCDAKQELEKQGELVNSLSNGLDNAHERIDGLIQKSNSLIEQLEKRQDEQKSADKVESKFHKDNWIIHQGTENIYQVVAVIDNQYQLKYGDNYTIQYCKDVDRCARLWDVTKDAKDGDVLAYRGEQWIFIYKERKDETLIEYHALTSERGLTINDVALTVLLSCIVPATKEQRDLLFKKMKDAGYEWDADKKELKKIEQKPEMTPKFKVGDTIWKKSDHSNKITISSIDEYFYYANSYNIIIDIADNDWELVEQNLAWNEEDELHIRELESLVKRVWATAERENDKDTIHKMSDLSFFLKTLKPQLKQEWSEDDDKNLEKTIWYVEKAGKLIFAKTDELVSWLKFLKERNTWKPSEEQIKVLYEVLNFAANHESPHWNDYIFGTLNNLIRQLKKLKS